jgi:hypothetical protein
MKLKKRVTSICDAISTWSIHFPECMLFHCQLHLIFVVLDEIIDKLIDVFVKISKFPVPLLRTQVSPLKYLCMLFLATREQDLGSGFSVIPLDLMVVPIFNSLLI